MAKIIVKDTDITVLKINEADYISLTDIAKYKSEDPNATIANWIRNRNTIEFLGLWEKLFNPDFKPLEFEGFRKEAGLNAFTLSPKKWMETTNAIGIIARSGRYGGTFGKAEPDCNSADDGAGRTWKERNCKELMYIIKKISIFAGCTMILL